MKMEVFRMWSAAHALSFRPKLFFDWTTSHPIERQAQKQPIFCILVA